MKMNEWEFIILIWIIGGGFPDGNKKIGYESEDTD
jgi:hypothetical protein